MILHEEIEMWDVIKGKDSNNVDKFIIVKNKVEIAYINSKKIANTYVNCLNKEKQHEGSKK